MKIVRIREKCCKLTSQIHKQGAMPARQMSRRFKLIPTLAIHFGASLT